MIKGLGEKASAVASIMLADIIHDVDLLTVALCAGNLNEIAYTICYSNEGDYKHTAAHKALDLGWKPALREDKVNEGYFKKGLRGLIDLAKQYPDTGSRLMPVFCEMVANHRDYGVPRKLKREAICCMEQIRQRDGFAITSISDDGKVHVKASDDILEALGSG